MISLMDARLWDVSHLNTTWTAVYGSCIAIPNPRPVVTSEAAQKVTDVFVAR